MIYVDALSGCLVSNNWQHTRFCHLTADTEEELVAFAKRIGCSAGWLQHSRTGMPHFDLTARMRDKAIEHGAVQINRDKVVELIRRHR